MSERPLISILIPVYNAELFLAACLDSALGQSYSHLEVVAVNDGSTDGSLAVLQDYAGRDSRLRVVDKPNEGVMLTRKRCIDEAAGDWVFFLDADDHISADAIEKLFDAAAGTGCDIASATILRVKKGYSAPIGQEFGGTLDGIGFIRAILDQKTHIGMPGRLYRRSLLTELHYYPEISIGEDMLLNIQIAMQPGFGGMCFVREALYYYIQHDASLVHRKVGFDYQERFAQIFDAIFDARPDIASQLQTELLKERVMRLHVYIKRSSNPWMGDRGLATAAHDEVRRNRRQIRDITPRGTVAMVSMYRHRWLHPAVITIATFQRWRNSITRRLNRHKK